MNGEGTGLAHIMMCSTPVCDKLTIKYNTSIRGYFEKLYDVLETKLGFSSQLYPVALSY